MKDKILKILVTLMVFALVAVCAGVLFSPSTSSVVNASYPATDPYPYPEPYPSPCPFGGCNVPTVVYETCWIEVGDDSGFWGLCAVSVSYDSTPVPDNSEGVSSYFEDKNRNAIIESEEKLVSDFLRRAVLSINKLKH